MADGFLLASIAVINFASLIISLWLGFYIVTRSPRSRVSWLAGATLWSLCAYFLSSLTYVQSSPQETLPWWLGWSVVIAVPFWFHLSVSFLPSQAARKQRLLVIFVYLLTLNIVAMMTYTPWVFAGATLKSPFYYSAQRPGALFPLLGIFLIIAPALSLHNFYRSWRQAQSPAVRQRFATLLWATSLAVFSGVYASLSIWLGLDAPVFINNLSLGAALVLLGYGVARCNALVEGRTIRRDFTYTALAIGLIVAAYVAAAFISDLVFDVPFITFVLIIVLAIVSHSLYDWGRTTLDRFFYRQQYRELRANLRDFARTTTPDQDIHDRLQAILEALCRSLEVGQGLVALREGAGFSAAAGWKVGLAGQPLSSESLTTDDIVTLSPPAESLGIPDGVLVVPLHAGGEQIGAIALGQKNRGGSYTEDDFDLLEDFADTVAGVVHAARLQEQSVQQIDTLLRGVREQEREVRNRMRAALTAEARPPLLVGQSETEATSQVEDALRHLYDYPYLGEHPLAQLRVIRTHLDVQDTAFVTHLDRGRALQKTLLMAIEKLKPSSLRAAPPGREWHQYVILHDCYVLGKPNRDVMSDLYIGEGTFNRARRRAVRGVARALAEMERQARREGQM